MVPKSYIYGPFVFIRYILRLDPLYSPRTLVLLFEHIGSSERHTPFVQFFSVLLSQKPCRIKAIIIIKGFWVIVSVNVKQRMQTVVFLGTLF